MGAAPPRAPGALHHVALGALDVERVADFYERAFELVRTREQRDAEGLRSIWLDLGRGGLLMIERIFDARPRVVERASGAFLLAFDVPSSRREEAERRLESLGARIESRTEFTCYARDPEGNRVAISAYAWPPTTGGGGPTK